MNLEQRILESLDEHESLRTEATDLTTELGSDASACARHEDDATANRASDDILV
jgi:hypothetical protein